MPHSYRLHHLTRRMNTSNFINLLWRRKDCHHPIVTDEPSRHSSYCRYLTKSLLLRPSTVTCACMCGNPPNMTVVQWLGSLVTLFCFLPQQSRAEGEGRRNLRAHSTDVISYLWKLFSVISTSKVSATFHVEHSPLTGSKWMEFFSV